MFKIIDSILSKNNIPYFVDGGTALGCMRHRGFIPGDKDIDIGVNIDDIDSILKLKTDLLEKGLHLEFWSDYKGIRDIECEDCKSYMESYKGDDFIDSLNYGKNKNGFFFKVLKKKDGVNINCVDIFPYKKYRDTELYKPTCYLKEQEGLDYYIRKINDKMKIRFEGMDVPICTNMSEYLKIVYGENCLVRNDKGEYI